MGSYFTCKFHAGRGQTYCFYCWARDNEEQLIKMIEIAAAAPKKKGKRA